MSEENKAVVRRYIDELNNKGNLEVADQLFAADFVEHDYSNPGDWGRGPELVKQGVTMFRTAFPDLNIVIDDMVSEHDRVAFRYTVHGTHKGTFFGVPASGKQITYTGISFSRIADGKIQEGWAIWDTRRVLRQLGFGPPQPPKDDKAQGTGSP